MKLHEYLGMLHNLLLKYLNSLVANLGVYEGGSMSGLSEYAAEIIYTYRVDSNTLNKISLPYSKHEIVKKKLKYLLIFNYYKYSR